VLNRIAINVSQPLPITVERDGKQIESTITPIRKESLGFGGLFPPRGAKVAEVVPGNPAEKAGIQAGDEIIAVNGIDLKSQQEDFPELLQKLPLEKPFPIKVLRKDQFLEFPISTVMGKVEGKAEEQKIIGIKMSRPTFTIKLGFTDAVRFSVDKNLENAGLILTVLGKLFTPTAKGGLPVSTLEGPIGIIRHSGDAARIGLPATIMLMATISLNLGLLNLLPIPILDGGVMLLILIEGLMNRELSLRVKERIIQVSFVALLMLTAFVLYYDVVKMLPAPTANP
jgi:regulator of sigma E protease